MHSCSLAMLPGSEKHVSSRIFDQVHQLMLCKLVRNLENSGQATLAIAIDASAAHKHIAIFTGQNDPRENCAGVLQGSA